MNDKGHEATTLYGKLLEGLHITGYSFERACSNLESLIEGDDWKLGGRFKTINDFLETINLDKFRAIAEQRKRFAKRIKELQPEASNRQIAKTLGVGNRTVDRDVAPNGAADGKKTSKNKDGSAPNGARELSGAQAARLVQRKATGTAEKQERRAQRERELGAAQLALPTRKYGVVLADPEWRFEPWSRETGMDRAADNHYPTSVLDVIKARDVPSISADDCVLFLWATVPMLPDALAVMEAWGFDYRSHFVWAKDAIGTGYWNRNRHELLLVGVKGKIPAPAQGEQLDSLIDAPVGEHSVKPEAFYQLIEWHFPTLPKIELNARAARPGWDAWGFEAPADGNLVLEQEAQSMEG